MPVVLFDTGVSAVERTWQSRLSTTTGALEDLEVVASRQQSSRETATGGGAVAQFSAKGGAERRPVQLLDVPATVVVHARYKGEERRGTAAQVAAE